MSEVRNTFKRKQNGIRHFRKDGMCMCCVFFFFFFFFGGGGGLHHGSKALRNTGPIISCPHS